MIDYKLEVSSDLKALEATVGSYLKDGYEPLGGVAVAVQVLADPKEGKGPDVLYVQALVKR